jgi:hypothetical protein
MKGIDRQTFSIKCECTIVRNNISLSTKKKSKFSVLQLDPTSKVVLVQPYGLPKDEQTPLSFPLSKLRTIHKKYLDEGKMTLEFLEKFERVAVRGMDMTANENPV